MWDLSETKSAAELIAFDPKTASKEEWAGIHAYRLARHTETDRLEQLFPEEDYEAMAKKDSQFGEAKRFFVVEGDDVVGGFGTFIENPTSPGYESNKHILGVDFAVLGPHRRKGIGTNFLRKTLSLMEEHDKSVLTLGTEEDDGHAFLESIGAQAKLAGAENRLNLEEVDWDMVGRWVAEGREKNPDTELIFYERRIPEELLGEIAPVLSELLNTMPWDDLDHGEIVFTEESFKEHYDRMDELKLEHHTYLTKEPDGTISGMTDVNWAPQLPHQISQQFTGVHPDHRGRGLGKWLKAAMLEYIRSRYPEARYISTGNANSNDPMLGINKKLGFKTHRGGSTYQISRDDLAKYLASRS